MRLLSNRAIPDGRKLTWDVIQGLATNVMRCGSGAYAVTIYDALSRDRIGNC
jgi:hypothetical protein